MVPIIALTGIVLAILLAQRQPALRPLFRWLPVPLWCYALPLVAVELGWLPQGDPSYRLLTHQLLPFALALLLLGTDLPAILRTGGQVLIAALAGTVGIVTGAVAGLAIVGGSLPANAWKGAGGLAGTWSGGTMNLLSLRAILEIPESLFAPLVVIDAMIAYSWMALLVAGAGFQGPVDRWLRATSVIDTTHAPDASGASQSTSRTLVLSALAACGIALGARLAAGALPTSSLVSSATGWTVLLVTTIALGCSFLPPVRRLGDSSALLGYPCLYLVLAATGAQAQVDALLDTPAWILLGVIVVLVHGTILLVAGRIWKIPLGILATASQSNIGGLVSGPLVGAIYHRTLAPVGLLLAVAGGALGTYVGLLAATLCRMVR